MHVISRKTLVNFGNKHPSAMPPLNAWFAEAKRAEWKSFADIKLNYRSADVVSGNRVIFNIGGNKYRLVVKIAYESKKVFIRFIGTHAEYTKLCSQRKQYVVSEY